MSFASTAYATAQHSSTAPFGPGSIYEHLYYRPELQCEVAFTANVTDAPETIEWTPLTERLRGGVQVSYGRQKSGGGRTEAGTVTFYLNNHDRALDPLNTASPHYPHIKPLRKVRIMANFGGQRFPIFTGYVDSWQQRWQGHQDAYVEVRATDGFKALAAQELPGSVYEIEVRRANPKAWWRMGDRGPLPPTGVVGEGLEGLDLDPTMAEEKGRYNGIYEGDCALEVSSLTLPIRQGADPNGAVGFAGARFEENKDTGNKEQVGGARARVDDHLAGIISRPWTLEFLLKHPPKDEADTQGTAIFCQSSGEHGVIIMLARPKQFQQFTNYTTYIQALADPSFSQTWIPPSEPVQSCAALKPGPHPTRGIVKRGHTGAAVTEIQQRLTEMGYSPGAIDGAFGSGTEAAVRRIQTDHGVLIDGIVGRQTFCCLKLP